MNLVERLRQGDFTASEVLEAADEIERLTAENNALNLYHAQYLNDESIKIAELEVELAECRKALADLCKTCNEDAFDGMNFDYFGDGEALKRANKLLEAKP